MKTVKFSDVVTRANTKEDRFNTDKIYYVGGEHIDSNEMKIEKRGIIAGSTIGPMFYCGFKSGDILFVTRNPHLRKCGVVDFDGICSEKTFVLETKNKDILLQEYLAIVMQSDDFWNYCEENKSGGVNYFLNWSTLAEYEFYLPSLAEQKVLAEKLWAAYEVKQSYLKMIAATEEMVKSQFIEMIGSKEWPQVQLKDIVHEDCPISYGIVQPGDDIENGVPIVRPIDMTDSHIIEKNALKRTTRQISDSYSRTILRGDEILVCVRGTTGLIALADGLKDCNVTRGITPLYFKPEYNRDYIYRAFMGEKIQKYIQDNTIGSTLKGINMSILRELPICMPTKDIQEQYVLIANQADKSISELRKSVDAIDKVIKSLINENL